MTPKEKSKELIDKFLNRRYAYRDAKESALICVDEIIESGTWKHIDWEYWQDVKEEIEKL